MKKLNQKGFTHHLVMFAVLALVLGAMGFAGYRVYQNRGIDAQAVSYTSILNNSFATGRACKSGPYKDAGKTFYKVVKINVRSKQLNGYYSATAGATGALAFGGKQLVDPSSSATFVFYNVSSSARAEAGAHHLGDAVVTHGVPLSRVRASC